MALRGYDFFLIFRAKNYASQTVRKVSSDLTGLGHAAQAANAMQMGNLANMQKMQQMSALRSRSEITGLIAQRRRMEVDKQLFDNMTNRMRLQDRLDKMGAGTSARRTMVERQIESTYARQNILKQRQTIITAEQAAAEARINAQLKLRQIEMAQLVAQQRMLLKEQKLAPARAMMGRGAALTHVGALAGFAGLAGTAALGGAARAAGEFDTQASLAATQVGRVDQSTAAILANSDKLEKRILGLMKTFPATATEMADASYEIYSSMDINFSKGIQLLNLFNQAAVAGNVSLQDSTDASIKVLNNFAGAAKNAPRTLNEMFSIIRYGKINLAQFNLMLDKVAPAARAGGQSLEDVGGAVAVLTRRLGPQVAATGFARLMDVFLRKDFQAGMAKAGLSITDTSGRLLTFTQIIDQISKLKPGKDINNLIQIITASGRGRGMGIQSTVQARRALVQLIIHHEELDKVQKKVITNQDQLINQLKVQRQTIGVSWAIFVNQLRAIALSVGEDVVPAFRDLGSVIQPVIDAWRNLSPETRRAIASFAVFASFAALIGGVLTALTGGIIGLIGALRLLYTLLMIRLPTAVAMSAASLKMLADPAVTGKVAAMSGMLKGMAGIGVITIGLLLAFKGSGWQSKIGQLLVAAAVGGMQGGVAGAIIIPAILIVSWGLESPTLQDQIGAAREKLKERIRKGAITRQEANELIRPLREKGIDIEFFKVPKKQLSGFVATATAMGDAHDRVHQKMAKNAKAGWAEEVKGAKTLAEIAGIVDKYTKKDLSELQKWRKERANVIKGATQDAQQTIDQAADNLVSKFNELRDANKSAFGTLFEGPWLTGEQMQFAIDWGYVLNVDDLNRDLTMQIEAFKRWRGDLDKISKRGAPEGLMKELQALGPGAADKIAMLARANPQQFKTFVGLWKNAQAEIDKATNADFNKQLADWYKHGQNIAFKIIAGLESEDTMLKQRFRDLISKNFSAQFVADSVAQAVKEWQTSNPKPTVKAAGPKVKGAKDQTPKPVTAPPAKRKPPVSAGAKATSERESGRSRSTQQAGNTVHYHLDRRPGESVEDYLLRVKYHFRHV